MICSVPHLLLLFSGGLLAGTLGGLLGIGGGIILMPLLRFVVGLQPAYAAGTCITAIFFTTLGGSYRHHRFGHLDYRSILPIAISGLVACGIFSLLFERLANHGQWLDLGIGLVFLLVAARMVAEGIPGLVKQNAHAKTSKEIRGSIPKKMAIGTFAGVLPGLLGIGTGGILVPALTFYLGTPVKTAMAAALACFCLNALISTSFKIVQGFVDFKVVLPLCIGTLIGANIGAILNKRFSSSTVKLIFGIVFTYVSIKFILSFFMVGT